MVNGNKFGDGFHFFEVEVPRLLLFQLYIKMALITFMGDTTHPFQSFQPEYLTTG